MRRLARMLLSILRGRFDWSEYRSAVALVIGQGEYRKVWP